MAGTLVREVKTGVENRRMLGTGVREGMNLTPTDTVTFLFFFIFIFPGGFLVESVLKVSDSHQAKR